MTANLTPPLLTTDQILDAVRNGIPTHASILEPFNALSTLHMTFLLFDLNTTHATSAIYQSMIEALKNKISITPPSATELNYFQTYLHINF